MKINRILTNICSQHLAESKEFYTNLFNFKVDFDSDWFVHLISEGRELEIGIMKSDHELVPIEFRGKPNGMYVTIVVDNAESIFKKAKEFGFEIIKEPELTFYGQKRVLIKDPSGVLVDVSSPENA